MPHTAGRNVLPGDMSPSSVPVSKLFFLECGLWGWDKILSRELDPLPAIPREPYESPRLLVGAENLGRTAGVGQLTVLCQQSLPCLSMEGTSSASISQGWSY